MMSQGQFVLGHQGQGKRANSSLLLNRGTNQRLHRSPTDKQAGAP